MPLFHHITVFFVSEQEKAAFSAAGVEFSDVTLGSRGESASFDMGEDDPRWERVVAIISAIEGRDGMPKEYRVQNISMTAPTMEDSMRQTMERVAATKNIQAGPKWLEYSGENVDQLLSLEGEYRTASLVLAFEQAINEKAERGGKSSFTDEERIVLAVEALEREVNNGGYHQFFVNSSREFAPTIVGALQRIGCKKTAGITQRAIKALGTSDLTVEAIETAMAKDDESRLAKLNRCDDSYYNSTEPIAERLFEFVKANKASIRF
jgi:Domain of unknown function (DUF4375)